MGHITLTPDQVRSIRENGGKVEFRDPHGRWLGTLETHGLTAEDIEECERRRASKGPKLTSEQVIEHLHQLERDEKFHRHVG